MYVEVHHGFGGSCMKKFISIQQKIVMMLTLVLIMTSCATNPTNPTPSPGTPGRVTPAPGVAATPSTNPTTVNGQGFMIGMVTDIGGVNDKSFNESAWDALEELEQETGATVKYLQSKTDADYIPNLNQFVKGNYNLTWGIGFNIEKALRQVAQQNPHAQLAIIDNVVDMPNVVSVTFAEQEGAYLVGVLAGLMTKSNKIGFVGGMDNPVIKRFEAGFAAGVKAVNPQAELKINYAGAFDKPDLGKSAAATLYNSGVDIIFPAAGATGNGVFNEAKDRKNTGQNVWVIGVDKDQSVEFGTDITLTSMIKRVDEAVLHVSLDVITGKFKGGQTIVMGLKDNGVGLAGTSNVNVPADVLKQVDEYRKRIISGDIIVPER